jgi:hypothetical protein
VKTNIIVAVCLLLVGLGFTAGYYVGYKGQKVVRVPVFKYLPAPLSVEEATPEPTVPEVVYEIREVPKLVRDTIYIPAQMKGEPFVIAERYPIRVGPSSVTFTYFDPAEQRYRQDRFSIPSRAARLTLSAGVGADWLQGPHRLVDPTVHATARLQLRKTGIFAGASIPVASQSGHIPRVRIGIDLKLLEL